MLVLKMDPWIMHKCLSWNLNSILKLEFKSSTWTSNWRVEIWTFQVSDFNFQFSNLNFAVSTFNFEITTLRFQVSNFDCEISDGVGLTESGLKAWSMDVGLRWEF
jgi:hypothetical protein